MLATNIVLATEANPADELNELGALTVSDWLWAGGLVLGAFVAAFIGRRLVVHLATPQLTPFVAKLIARLSGAVVFLLGFFYAMNR